MRPPEPGPIRVAGAEITVTIWVYAARIPPIAIAPGLRIRCNQLISKTAINQRGVAQFVCGHVYADRPCVRPERHQRPGYGNELTAQVKIRAPVDQDVFYLPVCIVDDQRQNAACVISASVGDKFTDNIRGGNDRNFIALPGSSLGASASDGCDAWMIEGVIASDHRIAVAAAIIATFLMCDLNTFFPALAVRPVSRPLYAELPQNNACQSITRPEPWMARNAAGRSLSRATHATCGQRQPKVSWVPETH